MSEEIPYISSNEFTDEIPVVEGDFVMPFGCYKDEKLKDVAQKDPNYVVWLSRNVEDFEIGESVLNLDVSIDRDSERIERSQRKSYRYCDTNELYDDYVFNKYDFY